MLTGSSSTARINPSRGDKPPVVQNLLYNPQPSQRFVFPNHNDDKHGSGRKKGPTLGGGGASGYKQYRLSKRERLGGHCAYRLVNKPPTAEIEACCWDALQVQYVHTSSYLPFHVYGRVAPPSVNVDKCLGQGTVEVIGFWARWVSTYVPRSTVRRSDRIELFGMAALCPCLCSPLLTSFER